MTRRNGYAKTHKMLIMSSSRLMDSLSGSLGILPDSAILALCRIFWVLWTDVRGLVYHIRCT